MLSMADYLQDREVEYHKNIIKLSREVALWPVLQVLSRRYSLGFLHSKAFFRGVGWSLVQTEVLTLFYRLPRNDPP